MKQKMSLTICPHCLNPVADPSKFSFNGKVKVQCPHCRKMFLHPFYRNFYLGIILFMITAIWLFALASVTDSEWGNHLLSKVIAFTVQVMEMRNLILIPLFFWAFLRLIGMFYSKFLLLARKILFITAILAGAGLIIALLGGVAIFMWNGYIIPPLIGTAVLALFLLLRFRKSGGLKHQAT